MLQGKDPDAAGDRGAPIGETQRLLYELRVHQAELEMQNEELRQAQLALEESRAEYFELYNLAPAGYLILDRNGLIRRANLTVSQLLGLERGKLIGQPLARFIGGVEKDSFYLQFRKLMNTGGEKTFETEMIRSDGARLWIQLGMAARGDNGSEPGGCRIVLVDITGRRQAEEALRENENRLNWELASARLLQDFSTQLIQAGNIDALYDKTLDVLIELLHADCARLQLFSNGKGKGGRLRLLGQRGFYAGYNGVQEVSDVDSGSPCALAAARRKRIVIPDLAAPKLMVGSSYAQECRRMGLHAVQSTPLITRTGSVLGVFSTYWRKPRQLMESEIRALDVLARQVADLIESKQAQDALGVALGELLEADRQKDEFLGILSHEIRNPLASIMLSLSLLEMENLPADRAVHVREVIKRQAGQLARLVDDMLDVTRIKRRKVVLQKKPVAVDKLLSRTAEDFACIFQEKAVALEVQPLPAGLYVYADEARLVQVVGNLLHNALKFTGSGGLTRLSLSKEERRQRAIINVADNGDGMTPEVLRNLFMPFRQADDSLDHSSGGLGLGLALVKGMVELHGGEVHAYSEGLGKGSTFTVSLPLYAGSLSAVSEAAAAAPGGSLRVLVIEDIRDVADSLVLLLTAEGHETAVAYDGVAGINEARAFRPDVLLCDIGLPSMNGYQVARAFRADPDLKEILLVSLTGYARPEDIRKSKEAGFDCHLAKPVDLSKIRKTLARAAERKNTLL